MFAAILPKLINTTIESGNKIISLHGKYLNIKLKDDSTQITNADQISNQIITKELKKLTPTIPIISEESLMQPFSTRKKWREYWLIDPLDGTKNFINGSCDICINIAYIKDNYPIFGLIYDPFKKTHYYKIPNQKSIKITNNVYYKMQTSSPKILKNIVIGHYSSTNKDLQKYIKKQTNFEIFLKGSALKFCDIADGKYHFYPKFGTCYEWDTASGVCILEGAGGSVKTLQDERLKYNTTVDNISPNFLAST